MSTREQQMQERGVARARKVIARAIERGETADTPAGVQLAKRAVKPLSDAIRAFVDAAFSGKALRRGHAANLLAGVDPDLAAYITVRCLVNGAHRNYSLKATAMSVTGGLELELIADGFETSNEPLYRAIVRNAQTRGIAASRQARAVALADRKFGGVSGWEPWTQSQRLHLGTKLIELAIEHLGLAEIQRRREGRRTTIRLALLPSIFDWLAKYNDAAALTRPLFLPTIAPPKRWEGIKGGAYYSPILLRGGSIVTRPFPGQLEALQEAKMPTVYAGLNALQETPWRINTRVLDVVQQAWETGAKVPLPPREDETFPERPPEVENDVKGGEYRRAWRRKMRDIHNRNAAARSARFELARALAIAEENRAEEAIYFPHRLDFRGRAYSSATSLSPQGPDECRALLHFAKGKSLGEHGIGWLAVHGPNLFGYDKASLAERRKWVADNRQRIALSAADPLAYLWWTEADKPWSFLAWCFEWADVLRCGDAAEFVSHLPISLDGTCNGIQHFSAMLLDEVGGAAVNLVPGNKPSDIYATVAERVMEKLALHEARMPTLAWMAATWRGIGIDRKITKRPVMVLPYGGTFKSCQEYVRAAAREKLAGENPFGDELMNAETYLAKLVWESIGDVVVAARAAMSWLQEVARITTRAGTPLKWTTPTGFVVVQDYRDKTEHRIRTRFFGSLVVFTSTEAGKKLDRYRQTSAVSPNFVHSLDASAMMLTIEACVSAGITSFAMIHDSYGTHAADTETLARVLRASFVSMYANHDVLSAFRAEIAAQLTPEQAAELPPIPPKGNLNLRDVLASPYFFA